MALHSRKQELGPLQLLNLGGDKLLTCTGCQKLMFQLFLDLMELPRCQLGLLTGLP